MRVIPSGVELPERVGDEAEPAEVLYAGRLSPEKGVLELLDAAGAVLATFSGSKAH